METWRPGHNLPAGPTGRGLTSTEAQLIGNLFANLARLPEDVRMHMHRSLHDDHAKGTGKGGVRRTSIVGIVACLLALPIHKTKVLKAQYDTDHAAFGAGHAAFGANDAAFGADDATFGADDHLEWQVSLPSVDVPVPDNVEEKSDDDDDMPAVRVGLIDKWKQHEQYPIGMRLAELSVMWHVNGWAKAKFPCFLAWASKHFPYALETLITAHDFWILFCPLSCRPHICV